jgi:hypothetical protein
LPRSQQKSVRAAFVRGAPKILTPGEVQHRLKGFKSKHDPTDDIGGQGCEIAR